MVTITVAFGYHVTVSSVITSIFAFISNWSCYVFKTIAQSRHLIELLLKWTAETLENLLYYLR